MQVNNYYPQSKSSISFGKVIPVKVFINGLPTTNVENIKEAVKQAVKILQKHDTKHPEADTFVRTFKNNVPDYSIPDEKVNSSNPIIRNLINEMYQFLFTGPQVGELHKLAKSVGIARREGVELVGKAKTYESLQKGKDYRSKAVEFIKNHNLRLKEKDSGQELELRIYTKTEKTPEKKRRKPDKEKPEDKKLKFKVRDIRFIRQNEVKSYEFIQPSLNF